MVDLFVGVDVSKKSLDVALYPSQESFTVENSEAGISGLIARLRTLNPKLVVMESTGGYERELTYALGEGGLPMSVVNARQVRDFAKATGKLAKTDRIDANVIAHFASAVGPRATEALSAVAAELEAKLLRRRQLVGMKVEEKCRLEQARGEIRKGVIEHIAWLGERIREVEGDIDGQLRETLSKSWSC